MSDGEYRAPAWVNRHVGSAYPITTHALMQVAQKAQTPDGISKPFELPYEIAAMLAVVLMRCVNQKTDPAGAEIYDMREAEPKDGVIERLMGWHTKP